jgi:hypothetical protein
MEFGMAVKAKQSTPRTGYSPTLSGLLRSGDSKFALAAMGDTRVVVKDPRFAPPGPATVHMFVDGRETVFHIDLTHGIDPAARDQPYTALL